MLNHINIHHLLFIDIETVPVYENFEALAEPLQPLWKAKVRSKLVADNKNMSELWFEKAGVFSEFAKIICISIGLITNNDQLRITSYANDDEKVILEAFVNLINKHFSDHRSFFFCGHNIKEFDIPFICRRLLVNQIELPAVLDLSGLKPWEVNHLDTLELWKFGDRKNYTSLQLLAEILGIKTPKDDISGKDVATVYYKERDLERIIKYCQKDVVTVANLIMKFKNLESFDDNNIALV